MERLKKYVISGDFEHDANLVFDSVWLKRFIIGALVFAAVVFAPAIIHIFGR